LSGEAAIGSPSLQCANFEQDAAANGRVPPAMSAHAFLMPWKVRE
jgi:hypothetical protein